ncbi:MAG: hypothetical protein H8E61_01430 [Bacteroidetes bacterium]|nr:hypothetical protein [Bacteroidota bacterium]
MDKNETSTLAREVILEAIEYQIQHGDPPETKLAFDRLILDGFSSEDAMLMIGRVLAAEMFNILKKKEPYNPERYVQALNNLPEIPT